jgi:hypothetical protein
VSHLDTLRPTQLVMSICDAEFGLQPDNTSVKPVHLANGLARALTGDVYDTTALAQTLRRWVKNQGKGVLEERNPTDAILARYTDAFGSGIDTDHTRVNTLRSLALNVLGADGAVFDQADMSSYTLSSGRLVTRDPSDNRAGLFLAELLVAGGPGDASDLLLQLLGDDRDPHTTLAAPLLALAERKDAPDRSEDVERLKPLLSVGEAGALRSPTLSALRENFDRLARFEREQGSKLNSLRRMVLFGCFVVHVHMIARWSEAVPGAARPPILLDLFDGRRNPLRDASRATLRAGGDAIERLLMHRLGETLDHLDPDAVGRVLQDDDALGNEGKPLNAAYEASSAGGGTPGEALAWAYLQVAFQGKQPVNFLTELGRRAGYLTPWANQGRGGRLKKRYGVTAEFLETLVAATVELDDMVDFGDFLTELRESFGILAGRAQDDDAVRTCNVRHEQWTSQTTIAEEDLRMNVEALRQALLDTGYAREYADGQTVVLSAPEGEAVR